MGSYGFKFLFFLMYCAVSLQGQSDGLRYEAAYAFGVDSTFLENGIDQIIKEGIESEAFPGANVLVAQSGRIIFHKAYGHWTYDSLRMVQPDDIYDYASLTKICAGTIALMKLHGEGKFDLDAPLKKYYPKARWSNKAKLTFRAMLAHQAGLQSGIVHWRKTIKKNGNYKNRTFSSDSTAKYAIKITDNLWLHETYKKKMMRAIKRSKLDKAPTYRYSGLLFYLLPEIVENITGQSFENYLQQEFYTKIGATTIAFNPLNTFSKDRIVPTEQDTFFRKTQVHGFVHDEGAGMMGGISSNAGLFSTIEDLAKLAQLLLNEGTYKGEQIIAAESIREFTGYQYQASGNRRGLGFDKPMLEFDAAESYVAKQASPESYGHSGYTGTLLWIDPAYDLIFILFTNRVYPDRSHRNLYKLSIRPRLQEVVYESLEKE